MGSYMQQRHRTSCVFGWIKFAILIVVISVLFQGVLCDVEPTESQCRTFIEKALKEHSLDTNEKVPENAAVGQSQDEQEKNSPTDEFTDLTEGSNAIKNDEDEADVKREEDDDIDDNDDDNNNNENGEEDAKMEEEVENEKEKTDEKDDEVEIDSREESLDLEAKEGEAGYQDIENDTKEEETKEDEDEDGEQDEEEGANKEEEETIQDEDDNSAEKEYADTNDQEVISEEPIEIEVQEIELDDSDENRNDEEKPETVTEEKYTGDKESDEIATDTKEEDEQEKVDQDNDSVGIEDGKDSHEDKELTDDEKEKGENDEEEIDDDEADEEKVVDGEENKETKVNENIEQENEIKEKDSEENETDDKDEEKANEDEEDEDEEKKVPKKYVRDVGVKQADESEVEEDEGSLEEKGQEAPEEELIQEMVIPDNLRPRSHISKILKLEDSNMETILEKTIDTTLKALKGLYDNAIKPLEMLYKYRDLSNRHFGDPEIFSKPLILFMGPWSGGKSSTINYLLDNEFSHTSLRTGAEPSPAYFNILMYGEEEEILDGTQLAADWTFSGLQKFGQVLLDRLRGIKLPNKLLEKVNIVEIPGILEIRKQVQRLFPFNDACQWFIDRADIIFLVYDPSKLDVGPETEAILDQLKGREYQTRIILNKADQVKPEELMRVQGTLIWNISPLMSSSEPPIMYSTSLWSLPYENGAPIRLLQAQERAFLRDLREAIDKRVENKIASARRFAVRVRNHAKMVDCYLTTYYNHKTIFGNRKKVSDDIIEFPQKYHIYEGLSTLTNISRYDLPDPDVYRDFFKINPLYEFKKLSETCTYFRGCPINKLDVAIAYDLPELVGKYKKAVETAKEDLQKGNT